MTDYVSIDDAVEVFKARSIADGIRDMLNPPAALFADGRNGETPAADLPPGWVSICAYDRDMNPGYACTAPVVHESDAAVFVSVSGKVLRFVKGHDSITWAVTA